MWCPSCGPEYRAGSTQCADCRVALVATKPRTYSGRQRSTTTTATTRSSSSASGRKLQAQILRRRLETAGIPVMIEWSGTTDDADRHPGGARGARRVRVRRSSTRSTSTTRSPTTRRTPTSPRIEEHLSAAAGLLEELRTRLDELEAEDRRVTSAPRETRAL